MFAKKKVLKFLFNTLLITIGGNWGGNQGGFGGGPMRGNFGNNRAAPYHTGRSNIFLFMYLIRLDVRLTNLVQAKSKLKHK